jgi:hypothetical protein
MHSVAKAVGVQTGVTILESSLPINIDANICLTSKWAIPVLGTGIAYSHQKSVVECPL